MQFVYFKDFKLQNSLFEHQSHIFVKRSHIRWIKHKSTKINKFSYLFFCKSTYLKDEGANKVFFKHVLHWNISEKKRAREVRLQTDCKLKTKVNLYDVSNFSQSNA